MVWKLLCESSDSTMPNFSFRFDVQLKNRDSIRSMYPLGETVQALLNMHVTVNASNRRTAIASRVITSPTSPALTVAPT